MLLCLTANHRTADFALLETLSRRTDGTARRLIAESDFVSGAVVVSTCNRVEYYLDVDDPVKAVDSVATASVIDLLTDEDDIDPAALRGSFEIHHDGDAAEHLFAVSSGLDSVVVGEEEIAGQVRRSLETARGEGTTSSDLERLFQRASQTARDIKNRTKLTSAGRSLVRLSLDLAESRIADWSTVRTLVVGTGSYARATVAALRERGVARIAVYSASGRAAAFAAHRGAIPVDDLAAAAGDADLILTCTTAPGFVLDATMLSGTNGADAAAPSAVGCPVHVVSPLGVTSRLVVDLGLPRNVNPDVATVPGVELLDLETIRLHAPLDELSASDDARALVGRAARKFLSVSEEQTATPAIVAFRSHVFDLLEGEIARAKSRGDDSVATETALRHLASVLLHTPSVRARELAKSGQADRVVDAIDALFDIRPSEGRAAATSDAAAERAV